MKKIVFIPNSEKQILNILQEVKLQRGTTFKINDSKEWKEIGIKFGKIIGNPNILIVGTNRNQNLGLIQMGKDVHLDLEPNGYKTKAIFEKIRKNRIF
jgi:hypothetical protein